MTGPEVRIGDLAAQVHGSEAAFVFGRSNENTLADDPGKSALAEPAGAGNGPLVFMAGNFSHAERSFNGGVTWTAVALPGGPAEAPILCCDHDVKMDNARRMWIHSYLYINSALTNGLIRLDIRRNFSAAPACSYILDPGGAGNNVLPDYPHIGLTDGFLWISSNSVGPPFPGGQSAQMFKFPLASIFDCVAPIAGAVFSWPRTLEGQKVWVPAEGAEKRRYMVWSHAVSSTVDRWFLWRDLSASVAITTRGVGASSYIDADCRGGVNNADFWGFLNSSAHGFQRRNFVAENKVGTAYGVGPDVTHSQGHIHAYALALTPAAGTGEAVLGGVIASTALANSGVCLGFPHVAANKKGHVGWAIAVGGRRGGGGSAVRPAAGIADDFTSILNPLVVFNYPGIFSSHNPTRYGDYYNIHEDESCEKWFVATGYGLEGGTSVINIDSRWVEFGRNRYFRCWIDYRNLQPVSR